MILRTLIVDDENPARTRLRRLLEPAADFEIIAECANGAQALAAIQDRNPHVVFLDIKMPRLDGLEVCQRLPEDRNPLIVFVTAFDRYALQAFDVCAVDYLLKPFDADRFQKTLDRIRERAIGRDPARRDPALAALVEELRREPKAADRLAIKADGKIVFVRVADIDRVEADGNYVRLHSGETVHYFRETLAGLEAQLPSGQFLRINRSTLLNLDRIKELHSMFYGDYTVVLTDGAKMHLSRRYRDRLEAWLRKS